MACKTSRIAEIDTALCEEHGYFASFGMDDDPVPDACPTGRAYIDGRREGLREALEMVEKAILMGGCSSCGREDLYDARTAIETRLRELEGE